MRSGALLALLLAGCDHATPPGTATGELTPRVVDPEAIRKACAMEVSCFAVPPFESGGTCADQFEQGLASGAGLGVNSGYGVGTGPSADDLERYVACASTAPDCATALACASTGHGNAWCAAHPSYGCDGDLRIGCDGDWGLEQTDCAALGLQCVEANDTAVCTDGTVCDGELARCDGERYISCDPMTELEVVEDCDTFGETCTPAGCRALGAQSSCDGAGAGDGDDRCDGTTAVFCVHGVAIRAACDQFVSHCATTTDGAVTCVPDTSECTSMTPDSCDGDALLICIDGVIVETPCASLGLSTCQPTAAGARCS